MYCTRQTIVIMVICFRTAVEIGPYVEKKNIVRKKKFKKCTFIKTKKNEKEAVSYHFIHT